VCSPAAAAVALRDLASAMSESSAFREGITLRWVRMSANCAFGVILLVFVFVEGDLAMCWKGTHFTKLFELFCEGFPEYLHCVWGVFGRGWETGAEVVVVTFLECCFEGF
jgi:hypothetical protein